LGLVAYATQSCLAKLACGRPGNTENR